MGSKTATSQGLFEQGLKQHIEVVRKSFDLSQAFFRLAELCITALESGGKLLLFGNGGSAADAQHIAAELVGRFQAERRPLAAIALTTDTSALTAIGNDYGYDQVFARQVTALARPGDIIIGISTSGNSASVLLALKEARAKGCIAAGFSGGDGGHMNQIADPLLIVPSYVTARIQEVHIVIGHLLCQAIEHDLIARDS